MDRKSLLIKSTLLEGGLLVLAVVLGFFFNQPIFDQFNFGWSAWMWGVLGTLPLLAALLWLDSSQVKHLVALRQLVDQIVRTLFTKCTIWDLALISLLAGVGEEALFRGFLQSAMVPSLGPVLAVLIAAVIFGLLHYLSLTYAIYATLMGIYMGWLLLIFDNLLVPTIVHAVYDFAALYFLVIYRKPEELSERNLED